MFIKYVEYVSNELSKSSSVALSIITFDVLQWIS